MRIRKEVIVFPVIVVGLGNGKGMMVRWDVDADGVRLGDGRVCYD